MNWKTLTSEEDLKDIIQRSYNNPQVIFKHSTRCSISSMAKNRLERSDIPAEMDFYYLDLLKFRGLSDKIAESFDVFHESPQVLLIHDGECIYDESHSGISMEEIRDHARV